MAPLVPLLLRASFGNTPKSEVVGVSKIAITIKGKSAKRGERMMTGKGWRLVKNRVFVGILLDTLNLSKKRRLAVFSVPK